MKAEKYAADWLNTRYGGAKDLDDWTPADVFRFADDFAAQSNQKQKRALLMCAEFFGRELYFDTAEINTRLQHKFKELKRLAYDALGNPTFKEADEIKGQNL
jgi:hypothetical protein